MNKPKLDLSKPNCHICGQRLLRNVKAETEKCINFFCQVKNIEFHIPYVVEKLR